MKTIATLAAVPSKGPRDFEFIWRSLETLYQPSNPPMSKGELLVNIKELRKRGVIDQRGNSYYLGHAGQVELSERILSLKGPLDVEKMYLMLAIGMFFMTGRLELTEEAGMCIKDRLVQGMTYQAPAPPSLF